MIKYEDLLAKITCDKCGITAEEPEESSGRRFYTMGWVFSSSAKIYKHRCKNCQTKKELKAHNFVQKMFNS